MPDAPAPDHERRRQPDLGDGRFLNPILGGDFPDPSILRGRDRYYLAHSSFDYTPGLLIWESLDLVNWRPLVHALAQHDGDVWAPDLVEHAGRFYIYYRTSSSRARAGGNHVVHADRIEGPWSDPVDLKVGHIDPGHVAARDGRRFLHLSGGLMVELTPDGLATAGEPRRVFDPWPLPAEPRYEGVALEGPKLFWKDGWCHLLAAQGGTAGPATSHMVIHARARNHDGPWEYSPHNPIVRTRRRSDRWWSRGHGSLVQAFDASWWIIYHAYENGYYTLGRQTLLEPIEWTADGWCRVPAGVDPQQPIRKPAGQALPHGLRLSDGFASATLGPQWRFRGPLDPARFEVGGGRLVLRAAGTTPADSPPLLCIPTEHAYEVSVEVELLAEGAEAGLLLWYSPACAAGLSLGAEGLRIVRRGRLGPLQKDLDLGRRAELRLVNDHHEVDQYVRAVGGPWRKLANSTETSGYHHNSFGGFVSLRAGLYAAGQGAVAFRNFRYRGLA